MYYCFERRRCQGYTFTTPNIQGARTSITAYRGNGKLFWTWTLVFRSVFNDIGMLWLNFVLFGMHMDLKSAFQFILEFGGMFIVLWFSSPLLGKSTHDFIVLIKQNLLHITYYSYVFPVDSWVLLRNSIIHSGKWPQTFLALFSAYRVLKKPWDLESKRWRSSLWFYCLLLVG